MGKDALLKLAKELGGDKLQTLVNREDINEWRTKDFLRILNLLLPDLSYRELFFQEGDPAAFLDWLRHPPTPNRMINYLKEHQFLPTTATLKALEQGVDLERMVTSIHSGNFNLDDPLHRDLEYARYLFHGTPGDRKNATSRCMMSKGYFDRLPWIEGKDVIFNEYDLERIDRTAQEAAAVFHRIQDKRVKSTSPLLVIGNKRYGSYFVIKPIEELLRAQGIRVVHEYVSSFELDLRPSGKWYSSDQTNTILETEDPEIVVVDGTKNTERDGLMRFPAAILGYLNTFREDNPEKYHFSFWSPQMTAPHIYIGDVRYQLEENPGAEREVLFICSTAWGSDYSMACFDDPEDYIEASKNLKKMRLGFTQTGITAVPIAPNVNRFVEEIQEEMERKISQYLHSPKGS